MRCTPRLVRLALCKGEGEGEGLLQSDPHAALEPLTLILSPCPRREAREGKSAMKHEFTLDVRRSVLRGPSMEPWRLSGDSKAFYRVAPSSCSCWASPSIVNSSRTPDADASFCRRSGSAMQSRTACAMHAPAGVWAMRCAARLRRLALRKGEGEGEGFFSQTHVSRSNPSP